MRATSLLACVVMVISTVTESSLAYSRIQCRVLDSAVSMASRLCICEPCHLCAFQWSSRTCQHVTTNSTDLSDGSEIMPRQPTLDPSAWFLSEDEITASRHGVPRRDLSVFTRGNTVETFIVGDEFFRAVYDDLRAAKADDVVYLAAWTLGETPFDPVNDRNGSISGFKAVVSRAIARGVDFRALTWQNLLEQEQNVAMRDFINALPQPGNRSDSPSPVRVVFDDRLPYVSSSHHQKTLVIRHDNELVAYVGGMDLTVDRWDTMYHNESALRREAKIDKGKDAGWLDSHVRMTGPVTLDVAANFLARWNSKTKMTKDSFDDWMDYKNHIDHIEPLPDLASHGQLHIPVNGTTSVQITRTFTCRYDGYSEFAPRGERSLFDARLKAIREAKNFIFVEDQYFIDVPELREALLEVLPRLQRLVVVVQRPYGNTIPMGFQKYLFDMVSPIQQRFPNKLQLFTLKQARNLYIHTKMIVIDDVYVSIGSANWNRRGMTSDPEISANIVDTELVRSPEGLLVAKTARDYRVRKFMEYTGKSYEEINSLTFLEAASVLDQATQDPQAILDIMEVGYKAPFALISQAQHQFIDPNDECSYHSEPVKVPAVEKVGGVTEAACPTLATDTKTLMAICSQ